MNTHTTQVYLEVDFFLFLKRCYMLLFKNQHYYLQWYILINMFSLMVFQGLNIFSKQNQEGVCPPHIYPLSVAKPLLLKEIWIR